MVTERADQGEDAAELVVVDYDPLPVVVDPMEALQDEILLFPAVGTNVCGDSAHMGVPPETRRPVRRVRGRGDGAAREPAPGAVPAGGAVGRRGVDRRGQARALGDVADPARGPQRADR